MTGNELIVPQARHAVAEAVVQDLPKLRPFVQSNEQQFFAACVAEVNKLPPAIDRASTRIAVMNLSIIGLVPGDSLQHAYLVPFENKRSGKVLCQIIVGYKGYLELAFSNDFLTQVDTEVLLQGEEYKHWHDEEGPHFRHEIPLEREANRQTLRGAYCTYKTRGGGRGFVFVRRDEINRVDTNKHVWRSDYVAMCRKSAVRRAARNWHLTRQLSRAVYLDDMAETGGEQTCPEFAGDEPQHDPKQSLYSHLMATLRSAGYEDATDRAEYVQEHAGKGWDELTEEDIRGLLERLNETE